jgi:hypothetical protein
MGTGRRGGRVAENSGGQVPLNRRAKTDDDGEVGTTNRERLVTIAGLVGLGVLAVVGAESGVSRVVGVPVFVSLFIGLTHYNGKMASDRRRAEKEAAERSGTDTDP